MRSQEIREMSDVSLYHEWQDVKENGPTLRFDEIQAEISERWEGIVEDQCEL